LVGSLITAIIEFGQQTTGMGVCFIELSNVSITIVTNDVAKIFCALFYDREDGVIFGRLICSEILNAFTQEYSSDLTQFGRNLKDFHGFHRKINQVVRHSAKPILMRLESHDGIQKVLLIDNSEIIESPNAKVDQLSLLASYSYLTDLCSDLSKYLYLFALYAVAVSFRLHLSVVSGRYIPALITILRGSANNPYLEDSREVFFGSRG
jgi:hypothetical protein